MDKAYQYEDVPRLPKRVVDMANSDFAAYHKGRVAFDNTFVLSVFRAQDRVELELLKEKTPGRTVSDRWWRFGFVAKDDGFNEELDAERLLVERHQLKAAGRYQEADAIRQRLEGWGYEIGDEAGGTSWIVRN